MGNSQNSRVVTELRAGDAVCAICPEIGGSIARWAIGEQEMFRRAADEIDAMPPALGMASFPLVPYSNRIGFGRFNWRDRDVNVALNFPSEPHAIHGTGWINTWIAEPSGPSAIIMRCRHDADDNWPWSFEAEQHIMLSPESLSLRLVVRNLSDQSVPLAFGHHPYFDSEGATLSFNAGQVWDTGIDGLPSYPQTPQGVFDFANGEPVKGRILDNCYAGWDGKASIAWTGRPRGLEIEADMQAAIVYAPDGESYFCFEPVPHIINALNLPSHQPQMPMVAPGGSFQSSLHFKAILI